MEIAQRQQLVDLIMSLIEELMERHVGMIQRKVGVA